MTDTLRLWALFPVGYLLSVAIEGPILFIGLAPRHGWRRRLFAAIWLTACTYPVVALVLPWLMYPVAPRWGYLCVAETFAPLAECVLFEAAFGKRGAPGRWRDWGAITAANLTSFLFGEAFYMLLG